MYPDRHELFQMARILDIHRQEESSGKLPGDQLFPLRRPDGATQRPGSEL